MGFLGILVQAVTALLLIYRGYFYQDVTSDLNIALILAAPVLFMIGAAVRHNAKSSRSPRGFFKMIKFIIVSYITGLVVSAIFFGIGVGLYYILVLRPAEGTGRF